ncbi:SusC/RagA family TonB-linked outer membrane protein [candidate division KSB1 bacterium]|nr:SusC/RagA family TonB-linked outer membrane protein [candidate division KSB1 bacterium]
MKIVSVLILLISIVGYSLLSADLCLAATAGTVKGKVIDETTDDPLSYAQVQIVGTHLGSITDFDGRFSIDKVPPGKYEVIARFIGYKSQTHEVRINAGETSELNFSLVITAIAMDAIVVTGTAGETERKAVGNTVATVSMAEIGDMPVASVSEVLKGRAPGVVAIPSSGQAGAGTALRVRGMTSISMSNEPIIYVDGVRIDNFNYPDVIDKIYDDTGGQESSRLNDVSPSDIERVEVIKGAAATTLYGTEASNGVIQIFTKRGTRGAPRFHFEHQRGWSSIPKIDVGQMVVNQALIDSIASIYADDPEINVAEDFPNLKVGADPVNSLFRTAPNEAYGISIRGGSDLAQYYVSGRYQNDIGSAASNAHRRYNFRANIDADVTDKIKISARSGFMNTFLRRPMNDNSIFGGMGNAFLANLYNVRPGKPWGEVFTALDVAPTCITDQRTNRYIGSFAVSYRPLGTWTNKLTLGIDAVNTENTQFFPWQGGFPNYPEGYKSNHRRTSTRITADYSTAYTTKLVQDVMAQVTGGLQGFFDTDYQITGTAEVFPAPGITILDAGVNINAYEQRQKIVNAGYFGQLQLGWRERVYLTTALRSDGNSSFGKDFNFEYYPKVSLSYTISDESFWQKMWPGFVPSGFWNSLKLRTAYGAAGRQPGAYDAQRTWAATKLAGVSGVTPSNVGNSGLKPEKSVELEAGFDAGFFSDQYGLEFTYYNQVTNDALLLRRYPPSQGFVNTQLDNIGEVRNQGFECLFRAIPIRTAKYETIFNISVAQNTNKVADMGGAADIPFGFIGLVKQDYPISSFHGQKTVGVNYDSTGYGSAIISDDKIFVGQALPKWNGSFSLNLKVLRDFRIYALFDWATGMRVYNGTKAFMILFGSYKPVNDIYDKLDNPNLPIEERHRLQKELAYLDPAWDANFVEDADWLKFRELAVTYSLPREWSRKYFLGYSASVTFSMRNIATWTEYSGADPEVNFNGQSNLTRGHDFFTVPSARQFTFSFNVDI